MDSLESSVKFVLEEEKVKARVSRIGRSLVLDGPEPIGVATLVGDMPGVSWVAAGTTVGSFRELASVARLLAKRYLRSGDRFVVEAEGTGGVTASDVGGLVTSAALDVAKGARLAESARVRFRVAFDGEKGAAGVEVKRGPGGAPTGKDQVVCFVSGGAHSSVLAWEAVLKGFRVRLVHAKQSEESLLAVARLYSELSHRADPRGLSLEVLEGDSIAGALSGYVQSAKVPAYAGYTAGGRKMPGPKILAPLYLMAEEKFREEFEALKIKSHDAPEAWNKKGEEKRVVRRFGGVRADVSRVLDGLR